ncbi:hypothetical protein CUR178_00917 [Leishmania enriettii]|uniref:Transmembrane protein n=1 Tax=Leishmania enriettii TaxID=5663 RepID=A0A836GY42_LEIEN|nr:hypothetical protein CUR178_00917 [Leishmania enriettii]
MAVIRCGEATVYAYASLLCGIVAIVATARACLYALGILVLYIGRDGHFSPLLEHSVCAVALVAAVVLFGDVSALMTWVVLLATVTSGACCWSLRSFRWIGVGSFVLYSLAVMHLLGPALVEEVDLSRREWFALAQGQRVLIPSPSPPPHAVDESPSSQPSLPALCIYSYYEKVKIEGSASPNAVSISSAVYLGPPRGLPPWSHGLWGVSGGNGSLKQRSRRDRRAPGEVLPFPTFRIIASGDNTLLSHYTRDVNITEPAIEGSDSIHLIGRHAAIRHSHIYCIIPGKTAHPVPPPAPTRPWLVDALCLRLRNSTVLLNVTIHWVVYQPLSSVPTASAEAAHTSSSSCSSPYAWRSLHVGKYSEQLCADVQSQLQGELGVAVSSSLIECVDELDVSKLPPLFVSRAPLLVWLGWQLPGYAHRVQDMLALFSNHVAASASVVLMKVFQMNCQAASALGRECGAWLVQMEPYVKRGVEQAAVFAGGALCGPCASPEGSIGIGQGSGGGGGAREALLRAAATPSSLCAAFARTYATHSAFRAGAQTRTSVVAVVSAALDALDLVPGVWSAYAWAWRAEYRVTLWIAAALQRGFYFAFYVALQPIVRVLIIAAHHVATLAPYIVLLLRYLWRGISHLRILTYLARLCASMWRLEKCAWRYEWAMLKLVLAFLAACCEAVVYACAEYAVVGASWAANLVWRYNKTSFSTHMAVLLLQTTLIGIAMRNDLKKLAAAERSQATPARNWLTRCMPVSAVTWLSPSSFAKRFNGFWMLLRAHLAACVWYFVLHAVAALVLIGLSVLPFASKLYALALHYAFPWVSCQYFLVFFSRGQPLPRHVAVYFVGRMAVTTVLQDTIGDFIYHVLKDLLMAVGLISGLVLPLWAWPQRATLAEQVATAIADSLQVSPMPTRASATAPAESNEPESRTAEEADEEEEARQRNVHAIKQIDLSDAT